MSSADQEYSENSTPPSGLLSITDSASSSQVGLLQKPLEKANLAVRLAAPHFQSSRKSAASTAPTLDGLPEELLKSVLSYIESQTDCLHLCNTSHRYNRAATPNLYSEFYHELYKKPDKLHNFLRNIISKPELASYVRYVDLKDRQKCGLYSSLRTWRQWATKFYRPELSDEDRELFKEAAEELHLERVDGLETIAKNEEAQVALMLSRATNLTSLSITIPNLENNRLLLDVLRETVNQGTALQNLQKFTGIYYNMEGESQGGFELAPISSLFRLPRITTFHAVACLEPEDDAFKGFDCPAGTSGVTDIEFRRSSVCPKAMSLMLSACRGLKRFYCDWGGHTVGWSEINFPIVGRALRTQEHALEVLTMDVKKHYHTWPEAEEGLIPPLGSFVGFERLFSIDVPGSALIGWDGGGVDGYPELAEILPPCVRSLTINQWAPGLLEQLESLADVVVANFPDLTEISLQGAPEEVSGRKLQAMFDSKGASVSITVSEGDEVNHFE